MKLDAPKNGNYAATIVRVGTILDLEGLDNLVGIPVLGFQCLSQKGKSAGDLAIAFTAETQLSDEFAAFNNLYRSEELNKDKTERGYLEANRRIKALKLRGYRSDALLMPLSSVEYTGVNWLEFEEGDTFDTLNGHEICKKYEIPVKVQNFKQKNKVEKAFSRVDARVFPMHLETDNYFRSKHLLVRGREVVVTQKLHGTSLRVGRVPVLRKKSWLERLAAKMGIKTPDYEYDVVYGSRKVIKDIHNAHSGFYKSDVWTEYGQKVADAIPEGVLVYGELIGFTPDGAEIQKNYTYHLKPGEAELYVYRVATVNEQGFLTDLSWDGVVDFCKSRGLKWVPELTRCAVSDVDALVDSVLDKRLAVDFGMTWNDPPLILSTKKTVDEGVCLRQEGIVPTILKAKSPAFLAHETKLLDQEVVDLESVA